MKDLILDSLHLAVWAKDQNFRYIYCNENYARAAGLDSPGQIVGKTDDQMPWHRLADFFRAGDKTVFDGSFRINVPEVEIMVDKVADILVTESQLLTRNGKCVGLVGSYIDISGQRLEKKVGYFEDGLKRYYLGSEFNDWYLTLREVQVLKYLLLGYSARQTGEVLCLSAKTVESHIENLKIKLDVSTKGDIIATAIKFGLTQIIYLQCHNMK